MITKEQASKNGTFHVRDVGKNKCYTWSANGMMKTWKTRPDKFRLPIKFGLYSYDYLTDGNADMFHLAQECKF